jgi:phage terminase large subunit-like protein
VSPEERRQQTLILACAPEEVRRRIIKLMTWQDLRDTDADYERWVAEGQIEPTNEGWRTWLILAGRGFGKTRTGAEWIHRLAMARRRVRIALVGATLADARSVMVEGPSGLLSVAATHKKRIEWEPSLRRLRWPNGSEAEIFSGDNADGLRGPEHDFAWCDELAKWGEAEESWDNLQFGLRRGIRPRALVTTTPRSIALLKRIMAMPWTATTRGTTGSNINLEPKVVDILTATYGGTRVGRQELEGELIEDVEGALWTWETIARARVAAVAPSEAGQFDRIVVAVDPPAAIGDAADACGIIVAGSRGETLMVIEDATVQGLSPDGWANRVAAAALRWGATTVVAEANNGGAMVKSVIDAAGAQLKVRLVHAAQGKSARAEPIALRFEAGTAFFAGEFPELEAELAGLQAGGGYKGPGRSPDRADAMVWAMTALTETRSGLPRVRWL